MWRNYWYRCTISEYMGHHRSKFTAAATSSDIKSGWGLDLPSHATYMVVSPMDVMAPQNNRPSNNMWLFTAAYDEEQNAGTVMRNLGAWIKETKAFDQQGLYCADFEKYNLTLYKLPDGEPSYPGVVGEFFFMDYLFDDRRPEDVHSFDDLMWMLDRDKMALAMERTVLEDLGQTRVAAPEPCWIADFRTCCHPHPQVALA